MADELIEALRSGKLAEVRKVLKDGRSDAARQPKAIIECVRLAFQEAMELLLSHGADLNASSRGYRPLHSLLQEDAHQPSFQPSAKRLACLDWLLENGADPELPAAWPPARAIIVAAFVGSKEYVNRLKKAGAKVDGFAAAALGGLQAVAKILRDRPAFAHERDVGGLTALQCAAGSRLAVAKGPEIARLLLDGGADLFAQTQSWSHKIDATYLAASAKNQAIFDLLLERGSDPHQALTYAVWTETMPR